MQDEELSYFEERILNEIAQLEREIKTLEIEKGALQKQLAKARADRTGIKDITRKNSVNRVLAENSVLKALKEAKKPVPTKRLYTIAKETNFQLKETTFRSYLHRMGEKGMIRQSKKLVRHWVLPNIEE